MKGLIRKRSTTAARLQRAFSAKGARNQDGSHNNNNKETPCNNANNYDSGDTFPREPKPKRLFIMETPVQFTTGVQSQERHLFLFSDLLLVAKARSGGNFKLKEKVRVSEMWLGNCLDDVAEISKSTNTSFVMGWPTTNVVASFSCVATKDLWFTKLSQAQCDEREKEPESTTIQVTYYDSKANADICKTVSIGSTTTTRECIALMLDHLELGAKDPNKFQLWSKTPEDESAYPLIGHEYPYAIKQNCMRENVSPYCESNQCNGQHCEDLVKCNFTLRPAHNTYNQMEAPKKVSKKARKSPMKIHKVFRRSNSKGDITDGSPPATTTGVLFGHYLGKICPADGSPPPVVLSMLNQLLQKGPFTVGIFRKSANARVVRELKEKIDSGHDVPDMDTIHITAIAALFKDLLRSLPDCLLDCDLYDQWLSIPHIQSPQDRISHTLLLCSRLPRANLILLQHFLCILYHISRRSNENMMPASNLAVCVGPSLLWPSSPILALSPEASKQAPATVQFLIERCANIFGRDVLMLLGEPPETDPLRQDSGAEESDSLHSGHSLQSSGGMRRDDSSIDSLEREFLVEGDTALLPRKDKMSLTNLSRDSGLTMSDSQLYTPDEEESGSTSSSHSGDKGYHHQADKFQHYPAPNNPNAIYTAIYRRPEKVQNSYDEPDGFYAAPQREHTKVHVTYSSPTLNYATQAPSQAPSQGYPVYYSIQPPQDYPNDEAIYSVPNTVSNEDMGVGSNFQRHDWTRRKSNNRKITKAMINEEGLTRSTSEESLMNKYNSHEYGVSLGAGGHSVAHDDSALNGRIYNGSSHESEDTITFGGRESPLRRSKSAHQIIDGSKELTLSSDASLSLSTASRDHGRWHRSRSTPQIHDEGDRSYDSSTLSDDDSTPHVSRSNSRGKECGNDILQPWNEVYDDSRNSSFKSERTGSMCTVVSAGSTSTLGSNLPSYEEALNRRSLMIMKSQHNNEYAIREEKVKSARAKQLYEESLRIYQEENTYPGDLVRASPAHAHDSDDCERPPPLPPKSDPPPLPPKQKGGCSSRLKHLPPVHVDATPKKGRSPATAPLHKTIIYTEDPPCLPPKERTVIEIDQPYTVRPERRPENFIQSVVTHPERKSIETQTDDCDMDEEARYESVQTVGSWNAENHVTSVPVHDCSSRNDRRRGRTRRRDSTSSPRSRSMPGRNIASDSDNDFEECDNYSGGSRDFPFCPKALKNIDPDLQQEISWSVTQLRAIFGDSLNGAKVHPPPYRPPPAAHRAPISSYHINPDEDFPCRKSRSQAIYSEESYV